MVQSRLFFEPVEFHLQLANLLVKSIGQFLLLLRILLTTLAEYFRQPTDSAIDRRELCLSASRTI